jgi:hypothetical protein
MMNVHSFLTLYGKPKEHSCEFECAELWLDKYVLPSMIDAAQCGESSFEFVVEVVSANPSVIRQVLETKGYSTLWWPVARTPGQPTKQMKIKVFWRKDKNYENF